MTQEEKTKLYEDYRDKVYGFILGKLNNEHEAEDLCSDVFVKVFENLAEFDETKASLSTWIFTIMRNTLTDHYRRRRVNEELTDEFASDDSVEEEVCKQESLDSLAAALEQLDTKARDLIILHYYSGMTLHEAAEQLGFSYSYAKMLHLQTLEKLKGLMQ